MKAIIFDVQTINLVGKVLAKEKPQETVMDPAANLKKHPCGASFPFLHATSQPADNIRFFSIAARQYP